jgi:hypothetical protein
MQLLHDNGAYEPFFAVLRQQQAAELFRQPLASIDVIYSSQTQHQWPAVPVGQDTAASEVYEQLQASSMRFSCVRGYSCISPHFGGAAPAIRGVRQGFSILLQWAVLSDPKVLQQSVADHCKNGLAATTQFKVN